MTQHFPPPRPERSPFQQAVAYLRSIGTVVEPADIPGLTNLSEAVDARDLTMGQVINVARQNGWADPEGSGR